MCEAWGMERSAAKEAELPGDLLRRESLAALLLSVPSLSLELTITVKGCQPHRSNWS